MICNENTNRLHQACMAYSSLQFDQHTITIMIPLNPLLRTAGQQLSRLSLLSHPALSWNLSTQQSYSSNRQQHTDAPPSCQETRTAYEHCAQLVRQHDPDNFIWVVQLPKELRLKVLALRAFNLESMLIGEHVKSKEPIVTQIRFQWWRDALSNMSASTTPPQHPVLTALWDTLYSSSSSTSTSTSSGTSSGTGSSRSSGRASIYQLKRILDAREQDVLSPQPPLSLQDLEGYAESTASQLLYLQLAAAGVASRESDHAASHLGKAIGLSLLLRGTPYQASKRRSYLPLELCSQHKVSQEDIYRANVTEGLCDVTFAVAAVAMGHLQEARSLLKQLPSGAAQVMQQGTLAGLYLNALEKAGFNVFDQGLPQGGVSPLRRLIALKWNILRGTI